MVQLRLYTYDTKGNEVKTPFSFEPLTLRDSRSYDRENTRSSNRRMHRRPYARQEIWTMTLGAGFLLAANNLLNLQRMFDAHKIEWYRNVGGKNVWLEYDLDAEEMLEFERVEEIDPLRRITFKLVQTNATWFGDFENKNAVISNVG